LRAAMSIVVVAGSVRSRSGAGAKRSRQTSPLDWR
jgi:hypothetical protein